MINQVMRLVAPKKFEVQFNQVNFNHQEVLVYPQYLSICAADQRYYTGMRSQKVLDEKLPMALIHEAVGEVLYDPTGQFKKGESVVLIPNTPVESSRIIKENYLRSSIFKSSGSDGFMQNIISIDVSRIISVQNIDTRIAVLLELMSVSVNAIEAFLQSSHSQKKTLGVWGDGNLGYTTSLLLKHYFPESKVIVFGVNAEKLNHFSFVDEVYNIHHVPTNLKVDHGFECVGGSRSANAVNQIIDLINPQGIISLLGVSEEPAPIHTRMVLEKGLSLIGNSRSGYDDFAKAIEVLEKTTVQDHISNIISETVEVNDLQDIHTAFGNDLDNKFKTVMKWNL